MNVSDPDGPDNVFGTTDDGLSLTVASPCIDAGDGDLAPHADMLGSIRRDHPSTPNRGKGTCNYTDIGARELSGVRSPSPQLVRLMILGRRMVAEAATESYRAIAIYDNDTTRDVTNKAVWASGNGPGRMNPSGTYAAPKTVSADTPATLEATYAEDDAKRTARKDIIVANTIRLLRAISISGPGALWPGGKASYTAVVTYDDAKTTEDVTSLAKWGVSAGPGSINSSGMYSVPRRFGRRKSATISAAYSHEGITKRSRKRIAFTDRRCVFVDDDAAPGGDGLSWTTAYNDLQDALDERVHLGAVKEIWVAAGTYTPDRGKGDRAAAFRLYDGVTVCGGFAGRERRLSHRNLNVNTTILSGNIGIRGDHQDNSYHVVLLEGRKTAVLNGFVITNGHENGGQGRDRSGAGVYIQYGTLTLANCILSGNRAAEHGGGMYSYDSPSAVLNCCFVGNMAGRNGGAMYGHHFKGNVINCTLVRNTAQCGGAVYNHQGSKPTFINCILWDNDAGAGDEIYNFTRTDRPGSLAAFHSNIRGGLNGPGCAGGRSVDAGGNIASDPRLVNRDDLDGVDNVFSTADDGLRLMRDSPCIDAADGERAPKRDVLGNVRVDCPRRRNTGRGNPNYADIGAYEVGGRRR